MVADCWVQGQVNWTLLPVLALLGGSPKYDVPGILPVMDGALVCCDYHIC